MCSDVRSGQLKRVWPMLSGAERGGGRFCSFHNLPHRAAWLAPGDGLKIGRTAECQRRFALTWWVRVLHHHATS
ncbi:hypothetical protein IG631_20526 [Alternaria alternata]|nr:hypothetical protein IG631_20526 [Alternaria alternata]